jgi:hypothetical protein
MNDYHIAVHKNSDYFNIPYTLGSYACGWWLRELPQIMYQHQAQLAAVDAAFEWNGNNIDDLVDNIYEKFGAIRPDVVLTCENAKELHAAIAFLQQTVVVLSDATKLAEAYINALQEEMSK